MAYGVSIGSDLTYGWEDQSTILVTVSDELTIAVCASEINPAQYIDILHDQIESVNLEKRPRISQSNPLVPQNLDVLVIWLVRSSDRTLYLGAGKRFAPTIDITFTSVDEATVVMKRLLQCAPHVSEKITCSESEPLNLSQPMVGEIEEQGMPHGAVARADHQICSAIVSSATESVPLPMFIRDPVPDLSHAFLKWPKNISASHLPTTDLNDLRSDTGVSIENIQPDSVVSRSHSQTQDLEDLSEGSLRNSAEWRKGAMLIETAPELQDITNCAMGNAEPSEKRNPPANTTSIERDGDPDDFYNATPKGQDINMQRAEPISTHTEERQKFQPALEHTIVPGDRISGVNEESNAEVGDTTVAGATEMEVQTPKNQEHVNGNTAEIRKLAVVKKKYTSKKKLPATNTSKISKKTVVDKNGTDREAESLSVKESRFQKARKEKDEFDFPLSPQKTRTPKIIRPPMSRKSQRKEGAIGSPRRKKFPAHRSMSPDKANVSAGHITAPNINTITLPNKAPLEPVRDTGLNDEVAGIGWDKGIVVDTKLNGAGSNPVGKRLPRGNAKSVTKRSKNKDDEDYSIKKGTRENMWKANRKTRSAPRPAPRPRNRRAAALVADEKIKNSINYDPSQEQSLGEMTRGVEDMLPPNGFANHRADVDGGTSPRTKPQNPSTMFRNGVLNHDEAPEIRTVAKLRPQDTNVEMLAASHTTKLVGNQQIHAVILPRRSIPQRISVHEMNSTLGRDNGNRRAEEAQLAGCTFFTGNAMGGAHNTTEENELNNDGTIPHRDLNTENDPKSPPVIYLENSHSKSFAPSQPCMPNGAQETCSSEGLVSAFEFPDSPSSSRTRLTPTSSMIDVGSRKTRRFVDTGSKRRATRLERSYQKAENDLNQGAATAILATKPPKRGNAFASNLKKALSGLQMSVEGHRAPECRIQDQSVEPDKTGLENSSVRPSTNSSMSPISVAGGFRNGNQNGTLKTTRLNPDMPTKEVLQEPNKRRERLYITLSPSESAQALHGMENSTPLREHSALACEYSENENEKEEKIISIRARRTPKGPKKTFVQPTYSPHRIRRANSRERLHTRAIKPWATPTKAPRDVNRKSNLISFDSRGPRNQGVVLNQKGRLASSSQSEPSVILSPDLDRSLKRKLPVEVGETSATETDLAFRKRLKILTRTQEEQDVGQYWSPIMAYGAHRPSSQSTRVNENGSPMPFVRSRHFVLRDRGEHGSNQIGKLPRSFLDDDRGDLLAPGDRVDTEPGISASRNRLPKGTKNDWRSSSASSKRERYLSYLQSPKTNRFAAHRIHPDGAFIDVHAETEILPIRPPDPFTESKETHPNAFMEMLRGSKNLPHKSPLNSRQGLPGQEIDKAIDGDHIHKYSPSTESLSSDSSLRDRWWSSSESSSSDEDGLYEEESWADKLEPHQKRQLDALHDISQVS